MHFRDMRFNNQSIPVALNNKNRRKANRSQVNELCKNSHHSHILPKHNILHLVKSKSAMVETREKQIM